MLLIFLTFWEDTDCSFSLLLFLCNSSKFVTQTLILYWPFGDFITAFQLRIIVQNFTFVVWILTEFRNAHVDISAPFSFSTCSYIFANDSTSFSDSSSLTLLDRWMYVTLTADKELKQRAWIFEVNKQPWYFHRKQTQESQRQSLLLTLCKVYLSSKHFFHVWQSHYVSNLLECLCATRTWHLNFIFLESVWVFIYFFYLYRLSYLVLFHTQQY